MTSRLLTRAAKRMDFPFSEMKKTREEKPGLKDRSDLDSYELDVCYTSKWSF
jgi:hypothetical protein